LIALFKLIKIHFTFYTSSRIFEDVTLCGNSLTKHFPLSHDRSNFGSIGIWVIKGTPMSKHILVAPPVIGGKICD